MRKSLAILFMAAVMVGIGFVGSPKESDALQHLMRVYGVMGGASGDPDIQYVELRMTAGSQHFVDGHHICFFDAAGAPYARFEFPGDAGSGTSGSSILIGTTEFDAVWPVGTLDFTFSGNTILIPSGAAESHPVRQPAGKVAFGFDSATMSAAMCQVDFSSIYDSVAYGTGYTGTVNFGTKFNTDLPTAGTSAVRLTGSLCNPCARNNSVDYSLLNVNMAGNHPRNNAGLSGPLSVSDGVGGIGDIRDTATPLGGSGNGLTTLGLLALGVVPVLLGVFWLRRRRMG